MKIVWSFFLHENQKFAFRDYNMQDPAVYSFFTEGHGWLHKNLFKFLNLCGAKSWYQHTSQYQTESMN